MYRTGKCMISRVRPLIFRGGATLVAAQFVNECRHFCVLHQFFTLVRNDRVQLRHLRLVLLQLVFELWDRHLQTLHLHNINNNIVCSYNCACAAHTHLAAELPLALLRFGKFIAERVGCTLHHLQLLFSIAQSLFRLFEHAVDVCKRNGGSRATIMLGKLGQWCRKMRSAPASFVSRSFSCVDNCLRSSSSSANCCDALQVHNVNKQIMNTSFVSITSWLASKRHSHVVLALERVVVSLEHLLHLEHRPLLALQRLDRLLGAVKPSDGARKHDEDFASETTGLSNIKSWIP